MLENMKIWWKQDAFRRWLLIGGFAYAVFMSQGIPLWDDDFTSWFWKIKDKSIFRYLFELVSPISTQPEYWGFNERPLQILVYKFFYLISGYESWSYFLFKSAVYAGLGVMIYLWGLRLIPKTQGNENRLAAAAAAVFFLLLPGPMASFILFQDFAPVAELIYLAVTYWIWGEIEKTPTTWTGLPDWKNPDHKRWIIRWLGIAFITFLGYKSKADLKLIPAIVALYIFLVRRSQWKFFVIPVAAMALLAVPWGVGIFTKLPPFIPGSRGSEIGWMWQPASFHRWWAFVWRTEDWTTLEAVRGSTIALAGLLGPFLLLPLLGFLVWRAEALDKVQWKRISTTEDRARVFALVWFAAVMAAVSSLPELNYTFRVRYGILHMVPMSLLLAWAFGLFVTSKDRLPKWAAVVLIGGMIIQTGINADRSIAYRRDMGQVIVSVDQVYEQINRDHPTAKLALFPDFRAYDYRPDAAKVFTEKVSLGSTDDLPKNFEPMNTVAVSWNPSLWEQVEQIGMFSGCRSSSIFDRIFPCPVGTGTYLMRFIGRDPLYAQAEELRAKGDLKGAYAVHQQYIAKYPGSMAGRFVTGLLAYQLSDWPKAQESYGILERFFPQNLSIVYNHALALREMGKYGDAIKRLKYVVAKDPDNYSSLINIYYTYDRANEKKKALEHLKTLKRKYPDNGEITRLLAQAS